MAECKTLTNLCAETVATAKDTEALSPPFKVCVGAKAGVLSWDGKTLRFQKETMTIPDGTYSSITIKDGCIIDMGDADIPEYTPPACVEPPTPCNGGGTSISVSPSAGNLTTDTVNGIYTTVVFGDGTNTTITGAGTPGNPFIINAQAGSDLSITPGTSDIDISNPADGVISIGLNDSGIAAGTYNGITFSSRGIATGVDAHYGDNLLRGAVGGQEVNVQVENGVAHILLKESAAGGETLNLGNYRVKLTQGGLIEDVTVANVPMQPGSYTFGLADVTLGTAGTVESVTQAATIIQPGSFTTADGKTVTFDGYGRIVGVV